MMIRVFGCKKYSKLSYEKLDRELSDAEHRFLQKHESACSDCGRQAEQGFIALNMLRESAMEAEVRPHFEERVIRSWRLEKVRSGFGYWSPAVLGAAVAGIVLLAAIQMIAQPSHLPNIRVPANNEAMRYSPPHFPELVNYSDPDRTLRR